MNEDGINIEIEVVGDKSHVESVEAEVDMLKEYPELEDIIITPKREIQTFKSQEYAFENITVNAIESEELNVSPSKESQEFEGMYHKVSVNGDEKLLPENIKADVNIFGVNGCFKGVDTSDADATASDILLGRSAYVANTRIVGTGDYLNEIEALKNENTILRREIEPLRDYVESETGNPVVITDSSDLGCEVYLFGNTEQNGEPTPNNKIDVVTVGASGSIEIKVDNGLEETDENYQTYTKVLPVQKEFCKIGTYQDYFAKENGKWYEYHGYNIKTLIGNFAATGITHCFVLQNAMTDNSETGDYGFCDYFKVNPNWATEGGWTALENNKMVCGRTTSHQIIVRCDDYTGDIDGFNLMLAEKQPKVYYQLTTPIKTACTTEQEEILNSFTTYRNVTKVSVDGIGTLKVLYKQER